MSDRRIRVLDLRDTFEIGGPGKTILETGRAIDTAAFELHVGVFRTRTEPDDSPFITAARAIGMPVHFIDGYNQYDPRLASRTAALIRRLGIDIVHAHEVKSDVLAYLASFLAPCRTMTTLHGWIGNSRKQRLFTAIDRHVAARFDCVVAVSEPIRAQMARLGMPSSRLRLVHNGIVLDRYRRTGQRGLLAELAGRPFAGPVLASIGRLSAEKGHADLVEALALLHARGTRVTLVLVGDGPERAALTRQIAAHHLVDNVIMPGYLDNPQRVLEETDLLVLPSHTEGLPNAALEALAMHVPVLATRVGGTPEVITDGVTGRLVPSSSPDALASGITEFLADRHGWTAMAARGHDMVQQRFDFSARTRAMESIYRELAGAPR
ncbi:MAG: glycosyltransferase [Acidobacteria bacterium]|nr:glycosyltransferase [Acidobacteriota bacterium]